MGEPRKVGNFELIERIGQGGMGAVFKARQISMDRIVALKILPPSLAKKSSFTERFVREARASARLSHPNIVSGIDVGSESGVYYFAMEFVDGSSAKRLIKPGGMPEAQALKIGKAVAEALAHAHEHGIVHRDIKPDNILIEKNGTPKLCDLGLARIENESSEEKSLTQDGTALGTPDYISPEQARGERNLDARTDLYSLGATLYHMLTGKPMYEGPTSVVVMTKHLTEKCPSPDDAGALATKGIVSVLAKLLTKDKADRYANARELIEDLTRVEQGKAPLHASLSPSKWPFTGGNVPLPGKKAGTAGPLAAADKKRISQREPIPEPRASSNKNMIPLGVAAMCVLGLIIYMAKGSPQPAESHAARAEPAPPPAVTTQTPAPAAQKPAVNPADDAKRLFDAAEEFSRKSPANFAASVAQFERVRAAARGTEFEHKAENAIAAIKKSRDEAIETAARKISEEAGSLAAQNKFDSAIAVWGKLPADQAQLLAARREKAVAELREQAESKLKPVLDDAEKSISDKRWTDGKKALDAIVDVEFQPAAQRVQALRGKLAAGEEAEAEAAKLAIQAAAEAAFTKFSALFVPATLKGDLKTARQIAADAKADSALKDSPKAQELDDVCASLEKADAARLAAIKLLEGKEHSFETVKNPKKGIVAGATAEEISIIVKQNGGEARDKVKIADLLPAERKRLAGDFKAQSVPDHLALGIRALEYGDTNDAVAELTEAKSHSLAPPYQAILDEKRMGAVEAAAKTSWEALLRSAGTGKISEKAAKEVGDKLSPWEAEHGKTAFAASISSEINALKERLLTFGGAKTLALDLGAGVKLDLILMPAGKFVMGSPANEPKRAAEMETQHPVTLSRPFYMGKTAVTQEQYEAIMGSNPSTVKAPKNPVDMVSWNDAQDFCSRLSKKLEKIIRLPTEAEWEYACRAGSTSAYNFGDSEAGLGDYCWYKDNSDDRAGDKRNLAPKSTHPVGTRKPNAWGLLDMHGNVIQWCQDWFDKYSPDAATDPQGPGQGRGHVMRGGSSNLPASDCRSAFRIGYPAERVSGHVGGFGLRVVLALKAQ